MCNVCVRVCVCVCVYVCARVRVHTCVFKKGRQSILLMVLPKYALQLVLTPGVASEGCQTRFGKAGAKCAMC